MALEHFVKRTRLPFPAQRVFDWHMEPCAFERLCPPWESVRVVRRDEPLCEGARAEFWIGNSPFSHHWVAEHREFIPGRQFRDIQVSGPFAVWEHTHRMEPQGANACVLEDRIEYQLPGGKIGAALGGQIVRRKLERTFAYRHEVTLRDLTRATQQEGIASMKVAVSGASGLVGSALLTALTQAGHHPVRMVRKQSSGSEPVISWNPDAKYVDAQALEGIDAVVHLAGEGIADRRWTAARKAQIRDSRVEGTRLLCETLAQMANPPRTLLCASAIGIYGDRGNESLDEQSSPGSGFLADLCRDWEAATEPARKKGIRVASLRFGVILTPRGGALAKMLTPFKMGVGGVIGSGQQYFSWITLDDVVGAILHVLSHAELSGPVNFTAPTPMTNREFTKTLGTVLSRPTIFPMPAFAARLAFGEMADEMLLGGAKVLPARLQQSGYAFQHDQLEPALRFLLGSK